MYLGAVPDAESPLNEEWEAAAAEEAAAANRTTRSNRNETQETQEDGKTPPSI
jgi:hypothetical protein